MQCFGYCMVDQDQVIRDQSERGLGGQRARLTAVNAAVDAVIT